MISIVIRYNTIPTVTVTGVCHAVTAGDHTIQYAVGPCAGVPRGDADTGYDSSFHIFAEELWLDLQHVCHSSPVNCGP